MSQTCYLVANNHTVAFVELNPTPCTHQGQIWHGKTHLDWLNVLFLFCAKLIKSYLDK